VATWNSHLPGPLKLRAEDQDDIVVFSALLQDAVVLVGDMAFLPEDRRFVMVGDRLRRGAFSSRKNERIRCGICFDHVIAVRSQGFRSRDLARLLVLLALMIDGRILQLDFAGGLGLRLEIETVLCHLEDIGEPRPTRSHPLHPIEGGSD